MPNYVEPFAGSLAVLLARPHEAKTETVNDLDCFVANFWRALEEPEAVAEYADWPVNEADLHARHEWLHAQAEAGFRERMHTDPDYYDVKIAGWWVWGQSAWIGDAWCRTTRQRAKPHLGTGMGVCSRGRPHLGGHNQMGVHKLSLHRELPSTGDPGQGVHSQRAQGRDGLWRGRPNLGGGSHQVGVGIHAKRSWGLIDYFHRLADRLRRVRVCCGQWHRILGPSPTIHIGTTAVFLDPPYGVQDRAKVYNEDSQDIAADVRAWCIEHGQQKKLRIALCGYEGEHNELEELGWDKIAWKAAGGYGVRNPDNQNKHRERIWFSPHCLKQKTLFE